MSNDKRPKAERQMHDRVRYWLGKRDLSLRLREGCYLVCDHIGPVRGSPLHGSLEDIIAWIKQQDPTFG